VKSRGFSPFPVPLTLAAVAGLALGVAGYAFQYAKGSSYLGNDPATCANCHVMAGHYAGWQAAPHHRVATCNDCHTPAPFLSKYLGNYPENIRARPESTAVVEANCRRCHADLVENIAHGGDVSCIRCHASVGHLR
jgi:cytochrome c nitrite reductase small subunit